MRKKRLYYVPGLISSLVLPLLLIHFDLNRPVEKTALQLFLPSDKVYNDDDRFTRQAVMKSMKGKKMNVVSIEPYKDYNYDNDRAMFVYNSSREFLVDEIRKCKFTHDTTQVLEVRFTEDNSYADFVWLVNTVTLFDIKRYVWIDNSFYIISNPPPVYSYPALEPIEADVVVLPDGYKEPTDWDIFWWEVKYELQKYWYYISEHYITLIAFVALIIIPGIVRIRKMKRRLSS